MKSVLCAALLVLGAQAISLHLPVQKTNATDVDLAKAMAQVSVAAGVEPGATTTVACNKVVTLKQKFETQLAAEEESYAAQKTKYETRICEGLGCEPDAAKREQYQGEWKRIQETHESDKGRLEDMLGNIEEVIESAPFRDCPDFQEYLKNKRLNAAGKASIDSKE